MVSNMELTFVMNNEYHCIRLTDTQFQTVWNALGITVNHNGDLFGHSDEKLKRMKDKGGEK